MAFSALFSSKKNSPKARRRKRKTETGSAFVSFLETNRLVSVAVFVSTATLIFLIAFVHVSPTAFHILPGQTSTIRLTADSEFSYQSTLLTQQKRERLLKEIPPVYRIELSGIEEFESRSRALFAELTKLSQDWQELSEAERLQALSEVAGSFNDQTGLQVSVRDLLTIMNFGDAEARTRLVDTGLYTLRAIMSGGIFDADRSMVPDGQRELMMFHVARDSGQVAQARVTSLELALTYLRANLNAENVPQDVMMALFRILRPGLRENLVFDQEQTDALRAATMANMQPVTVTVEAGSSITEPNTTVTERQYEMLRAYQRHLDENQRLPRGIDEQIVARILLVLGMIIVAGFYLRLEDPMTLQSNGRLALLAMVLIFSLVLVRLFLEMGALFPDSPEIAGVLPYMAPAAFAPMIVAVLIGAGPAFFCGLLVSVFTAIIFGNRLELLVLSLLTASVAAYACRRVRRRSRVVRAGWLSGLAVAVFVLLIGLAEGMQNDLILKAMIGGQLTGVATGVLVVGLLPVLESLFKRTTDITLIELTDYNHPLLRRMQMDAPGTYHHSLMVANLSENAANAIGANALLCRVCCMFHDIGKLVKPEYFVENQREGINPHSERTPSFSALIIKSHVKEGVDLAIKNKLPRPVIDVIRQHHGTTLIRYFYEAARKKAVESGNEEVTESTYRYDGPKPQFTESAIILFADSVEAASRSLKKVTPQAVEELVEEIVNEKIADGQVDEAPLTIKDIAQIKRSFTFTLLNSLHSRIVYPKAEKEEPAPAEKPTPQAEPVGTR